MSFYREQYFDLILFDLEQRGLTDRNIREEIADHIACQLEEELNNHPDEEFAAEYLRLVSSMGKGKLKSLQREIMLSKNKYYPFVEFLLYFLGVASVLLFFAGIYSKYYTLAFADIGLTSGLLLFSAVFLPLHFYQCCQHHHNRHQLFGMVLEFLGTFLLLLGLWMSLVDISWGPMVLTTGVAIVLIGLLPLALSGMMQRERDLKSLSFYFFLVPILAGSIYLSTFTLFSNELKIPWQLENEKAVNSAAIFSAASDSVYDRMLKAGSITPSLPLAQQIHASALNLNNYLLNLEAQLLTTARHYSSADLTEETLRNINTSAVQQIFFTNGHLEKLQEQVSGFRHLVTSSIQHPATTSAISVYLSTKDSFDNNRLGQAIYQLSTIRKNVRCAEFLVLQYLEVKK